MVRDVELLNAEREVDRVEIFEGGRKVRQVKGEKDNGQNDGQRRTR